mgnify:FL=1
MFSHHSDIVDPDENCVWSPCGHDPSCHKKNDPHLSRNLGDVLLHQLERIIIDKVLLFRLQVVVRVLAGLAGVESLRRLRHVSRLTV